MPILNANGKRILFIHIPKAAGTSIRGLLESYGHVTGVAPVPLLPGGCTPQHLHAEPLMSLYGNDTSEAEPLFDYVFATVRHPIARLESAYAFQREVLSERRYPPELEHRARRHGLKEGMTETHGVSIDLWLRIVLARYRMNDYVIDNHLRPQAQFPCLGAEIFRIEDQLDELKSRLDEVIGCAGTMPEPLNTTRAEKPASWTLSRRSRQRAERFYAEDFATFNYS